MIYLKLFIEFFKIGVFAVGGGLATLPFLQRLADKYDWFSREMLVDMIAISESTPGPIGINMATYAGFNAAGIPGALVATLSIMLPAFFIITAVINILKSFKDNKYINAAFYGLRPAVAAIIAAPAIGIFKITVIDISAFNSINSIINYKELILFFILFILTNKTKFHPVSFIVASAVIGMIFKF